ncbi:hypothetical protein [Rhodococcus sp. OK302]|uniref:hypothetical protein n=1 Tax=Rhodococcus sp. OK302 TaxID=1882769 RepID=UPI000B941F94|nr:hypothetical protein [Rhodococcus sp. OK302]OYD71888.1 RNA polymerase sigma-70 factor (ECF subfamily) [Rhodococcus sp. OK302]
MRSPQHDSLDRLAAAARSGNAASMAGLYLAIRPMVVQRARAELDPAAVESVADAACCAVVNSVPDRSAPDEPLLHLVYSTTSRMIARTGAESRTRLPAGIDVLPEREREVLILRVIVGLDADDTAIALGNTRSQVLLAQYRALRTLGVSRGG